MIENSEKIEKSWAVYNWFLGSQGVRKLLEKKETPFIFNIARGKCILLRVGTRTG